MNDPRRKPFSQDDHDQNDPPAIAALRKLFEGTKYYIVQHPHAKEINPNTGEEFGVTGIDTAVVEFETNKIHMFIDVEVKKDWREAKYPFSTCHYLERKAKYAPDGKYAQLFCQGRPVYWVLFSNDFKHHLMISAAEAVKHAVVTKNTRVGTKLEPFHDVPLSACKFARLAKLTKIV